jgi:L-asparaginase II
MLIHARRGHQPGSVYNDAVSSRQPSQSGGYAPLVEVRRGATVESIHFGAIALADGRGRLLAAAGDPATEVVLRSTAKPAQVLALLDSGAAERFGFSDEEIAVMIGSHGGEPFHVRAVRSILTKIGLDENALKCGAHAPYHRPTASALRESGAQATALHNNCSGKHAGMLALAVHLGAPIDSYLDPGHPVQSRIRARVESLAGLEPGTSTVLVDGCSAPTFVMPLLSLALLYARLADPARGAAAGPDRSARRAVAAMRAHPEMIAGTDRLCTALMRTGRLGLIAKIGAEGMYGLAWEKEGTGTGLALKIADGEGQRSRFSVALEALLQLGILSRETAADLRGRFVEEVRNHRGLLVGSVATTFQLA